jgi:hypothetical protein
MKIYQMAHFTFLVIFHLQMIVIKTLIYHIFIINALKAKKNHL